jgi:hypothetical protein
MPAMGQEACQTGGEDGSTVAGTYLEGINELSEDANLTECSVYGIIAPQLRINRAVETQIVV